MLIARTRLMVVGLTVLVLAAGSLVAVLFLRDGGDGETAAAGATASIRPQSSPTGSPEAAEETEVQAAELKVYDLGTLKGAATIWGPKGVKAGSDVKFLLTGPQRYSKIVEKSPYRLALDTRKLRNGQYKLTVSTMGEGGASKVTKRGTLKIANAKPSSTKSASSTPKPSATPTRKPSATKPASSGGGGGNSSFVTQVVSLTNVERKKGGCGALKAQSTLTKVAQAHSADMAKQDYFSHDGKDGRSPFERMTDAGYSYSAAAENIAAGQRTPKDVVNGWMNSPGHKANILNCNLTQIGVGYATGGTYGTYWTQDFGRP